MAIFPQQYFTKDNVLIRTGLPEMREDYTSGALGRKFAGPPKGVYHGFLPTALGGVLTLSPGGPEGISLAKVHSDLDPAGLDVLETGILTVDYTASAPGDFLPDGVQVLLKASFSDNAPTTGRILSRTKTTTTVEATIGVAAASYDLAGLALDPIKPGTLSIAVNVFGFGPAVIADNGLGALPVTVALPLGGTVSYEAGTLTGLTAALTPLSTVIVTYTRAAGRDECLLCELTGTPGAIVVAAVDGVSRDVPIAYPGVDFGFMPGGSVEQLEAAVLILNEVAAARVGMNAVAHPSLKARLDEDLSGPSMAGRLGKTVRFLRSNDYAAASGVSEINVSGSFASTSRAHLPAISLDGLGSETVVGAVADPTDTVRNVCALVNAATGDRLLTDTTSRQPVFARLRQDPDFILEGTLTFTNAQVGVTGVGTKFVLRCVVGDIVQGADGRFYEIAAVTGDTSMTLVSAYQGVTADSGSLIRRRFKLKFRQLVVSESAFVLTAATTIRFFFPAFVTHAQSNFDGTISVLQTGERPPVPDAGITVPGKIDLAVAGAKLGAIKLQIGGTPVLGGPFHTLNFYGAPGSLAETSPGVINVTNLGATGLTPIVTVGPVGLPGPIGRSYTLKTTFVLDSEKSLSGAPSVVATFTNDFGYRLGFVSGGIAQWRDFDFYAPSDTIQMTRLVKTNVSTAEVSVTGGAATDTAVTLYLDAAGTELP